MRAEADLAHEQVQVGARKRLALVHVFGFRLIAFGFWVLGFGFEVSDFRFSV